MLFLIFFLTFETKLLLRPNLGASRDAPEAPSHTSMTVQKYVFYRDCYPKIGFGSYWEFRIRKKDRISAFAQSVFLFRFPLSIPHVPPRLFLGILACWIAYKRSMLIRFFPFPTNFRKALVLFH